MLKPYAPWILLGLWLALAATPAACGFWVLCGPRVPERESADVPSPVEGVLDYETPRPPEASALLTAFAWTLAALPAFVALTSLEVIAECFLRYGGPPRPFLDKLPGLVYAVWFPMLFAFVLPLPVGPVSVAFAGSRHGRRLVSRSAAWAMVCYGVCTTVMVWPAMTVAGWVAAN